MLSNIDAQIQEILLRSSPVNDNDVLDAVAYKNTHQPLSNIHIVGNNNVIVNSGLWIMYLIIGISYVLLNIRGF